MNLQRVDLNLLVHLDVLLREKNVTRAAEQLGITQPAMSNILRRLRKLFNDPLLVRSSEGMTPTERASNGSLNSLRRRRKILLMAGWVIPSCSAARVTFFSRSNTSRWTNKFKSTRCKFICISLSF
jgi:hypothetical protein